MEPIRFVVGEWRRGGGGVVFPRGVYAWRKVGSLDAAGVAVLGNGTCDAIDGNEHLGPIEFGEPEPEPTPLPGGVCNVTQRISGRWQVACAYQRTNGNELVVYGDTRRQAILRHNAAVAAIVAMESK